MKKVVIKLGTSTLTAETRLLSDPHMREMARQISQLHHKGHQTVLVTSGAIAAGREALPEAAREKTLPAKQMLAAIGQGRLMHIWAKLFAEHGISVGQILLTRNDFSHRQGYLNVRNTMEMMLKHRVIPIINENDTVATDEIKVGDNDNLSALAANLIAADLLILLTDQEGLYTSDPRKNANAELIPEVESIDASLLAIAGAAVTSLGTGGMATKLEAAKLATESGTETIVARYSRPDVLPSILAGNKIGTRFLAHTTPKESRKRWLLSEKPQGFLVIDAGAKKKLAHGGASLLPAGIKAVRGAFERGSVVRVEDDMGKAVSAGIVNYSKEELEKILGCQSLEINDRLGYTYGPEVIHRDDMVLVV